MSGVHLFTPYISQEFAGVALGDLRRDARCNQIVRRLVKNPAVPFTQTMKTHKEQEAFYRFLRNPRIDMTSLTTPHFRNTAARINQAGQVLIVHDTTGFTPASASPEGGFYEISSKNYGLYLHVALALSKETGLPLGLVAGRVVDPPPKKQYVDEEGKTKTRSAKAIFKDPHKQSRRWFETVEESEALLKDPNKALHIQDSEGDSYENLAALSQRRFVVRLRHNRTTLDADEDDQHLFDMLDVAPVFMDREVVLSRRTKTGLPKRQRTHPPRKKRRARIEIRARPVELSRPHGYGKKFPDRLKLAAVAVREKDPPQGCEPVCWNLLTSEPIESAADVQAVVDAYCERWRVEEYFDVLKNGCGLSQRKPETRQTAETMIALLLPMAWQLLWLRQLERLNSTASADLFFPKERVQILRAMLPKNTLPPRVGVSHILRAIALLGGHRPSNGPVGWKVLGRGFQEFLAFEQGWLAARNDSN